MKRLGFALALGLGTLVFSASPTTVWAADKDKEKAAAPEHKVMNEALKELRQAYRELSFAPREYAGHRGNAIEQTEYATIQVYAALGDDEGKAKDKVRNEKVTAEGKESWGKRKTDDKDSSSDPKYMTRALEHLTKARDALNRSAEKFGEHRQKAITFTNNAINEVNAGLAAEKSDKK